MYDHSSNDFRKQRNEICGENLSWHYPTRTGLDSTQVWYDKTDDTDGSLGLADSIYSVSGKALGHYTQVVWKSSTRLGYSVGRATVNNLECDYWVCQYCSGEISRRQFADNVFSPSKTEAECSAGSSPSPSHRHRHLHQTAWMQPSTTLLKSN